jgi:hypothetical protein
VRRGFGSGSRKIASNRLADLRGPRSYPPIRPVAVCPVPQMTLMIAASRLNPAVLARSETIPAPGLLLQGHKSGL